MSDDGRTDPQDHFEGAPNFRDLGGLRTIDGRRLRSGRLFRSDSLAELTPDDLARFVTLGVRTVIDLRDDDERGRKPNRLPESTIVRQHAIGFLPQGAHRLLSSLGPHSRAETVHRALTEYYGQFALAHAQNYARMFEILLQSDTLPALVHCTSGKDRTGFGVALVLSALGVARDEILADYLRSNQAPRDLRFMVHADVPHETVQALMGVRADYLEAAFAAIDTHWSGLERFLDEALRVREPERLRLRSLLLD
ncbi:MAG: tyrosine-protein phosphatase [Thauera propionica]|jgi:protein-tyrosine phosphatase|nr:tyrosine-protein phosphatase [Thauera propionica]